MIVPVEVTKYQVRYKDTFLGEYSTRLEAKVQLIAYLMGAVGNSQIKSAVSQLLVSPEAMKVLKELEL